MKKIIVILALFLATSHYSFAQKFAYLDAEYVLSEMPEYKTAQTELDNIVERWRADIARSFQEIDQMYRRFQAEQVLLSENDRQRREEQIVNKEKQARELQRQKFGEKGELFQERQKMIRPIQDKVYAAVETVVQKQSIDFVLDKSTGANILYANPKYDITDDVFRELGIKK